jgi:hypothetical protein
VFFTDVLRSCIFQGKTVGYGTAYGMKIKDLPVKEIYLVACTKQAVRFALSTGRSSHAWLVCPITSVSHAPILCIYFMKDMVEHNIHLLERRGMLSDIQ